MVSTASDNRILVRRASEHIGGRLSYRQVRNYTINHLEDSPSMGALKSVNNIDIHYQFADFSVDTPGYWKLRAYNDFDNGDLVKVNGVPTREYHHKQILKFDFSKYGDAFTDSIRMTLTNLLNEVFVTLFADNQSYISAVTPGNYDAPLTYSLELAEDIENADKCIFIIEDSQLDIGLLIAVERNVNRIFQIISDYLTWNDEKIAESLRKPEAYIKEKISDSFDVYAEDEKPEKKKCLFGRIGDWFKKVFKKKNKKDKDETNAPDAGSESEDGLTPKQRKKAEKALKKAERKSAKEEKKKQKQEEKLRKAQEKAAKKEAEATTDEVTTEETTDTEVPVEEVPVEETTEEENAPISEDETVEKTSEEEPTAEEISLENEEEVSEDE